MILIEFTEPYRNFRPGDRVAAGDAIARELVERAKVARFVDDPHPQPYETSVNEPAERAVTRR